MNWHIKSFDELTTRELFAILKTRIDVFVVEQNCAYPDADDYDLTALHLFAEENGVIAAYCRLIPDGGRLKIGRVLVAGHARSLGLGREVVAYALAYADAHFPEKDVFAQAQLYLQNFYASFGFAPISGEYLEDGIPHIDMLRSAKS
ncbi:GNAT family N-acetyltransferase [Neisseria perflava]|uniref:GNAT family N-acetyltransferase n=1 Tax=Neisseria perflava TaxID=33053 RepID=UPI00209E0065|nr:GNAT family N-acetyltransferase [Neisseria perflava]MCP1661162.1 ElaA protein [Neisseria perflava]